MVSMADKSWWALRCKMILDREGGDDSLELCTHDLAFSLDQVY